MTVMLAVFVLLYSGLLGCWALGCAARGATLGLGYLGGLVLLELTLLVRAGIELARLVTSSGGPHGEFGRGYAEPGVHAGYLLASIVVLPLVLTVTRTTRGLALGEDPTEQAGDDHPSDQSVAQSVDLSVTKPAAIAREAVARGAPALETTTPETTPETTTPETTTRASTSTQRASRREATWDALVAAAGCAAVAVVTIRMGMTGRPA